MYIVDELTSRRVDKLTKIQMDKLEDRPIGENKSRQVINKKIDNVSQHRRLPFF